ncbi:Lactoylglutathione lyase [Zancudomyces culisetae]|uniref:lactoylglutathione lyase n=1 Tax=Zancudomyces culisetae TaxID=1213189 RepID=A0A1R1PPK0_ZANCU|nr:Lactoylglutathione lyase [Zancudomyces culisetae]|eukprot:OMH82833.1 Lactoylglutathione lyase [Zancudomyces culisetae]
MSDTSTYKLNHVMYRVKDGPKSVKFYTEVMGMKLINEMHDEKNKFSLYFLGYEDKGEEGTAKLSRKGLLELTWNHGTEKDESFSYSTGNGDIGGYGHIAVTVDSLQGAVARFDQMGVKFLKRPEEGRMSHIAFIYDPDGYRIEILEAER